VAEVMTGLARLSDLDVCGPAASQSCLSPRQFSVFAGVNVTPADQGLQHFGRLFERVASLGLVAAFPPPLSLLLGQFEQGFRPWD